MCGALEFVLAGFAAGVGIVSCGVLVWIGYTLTSMPWPSITTNPSYIEPEE